MFTLGFFNFLTLCLFSSFIVGCTSSGKRAEPIDPPAGALQALTSNREWDPSEEECETELPDRWWTLFNDPQLTGFIETVFMRNPTFHDAIANVMRAEAIAAQVKSSLYPQIFLGADVSRQKLSETGIIPFDTKTSGISAAESGNNPAGALSSIPGVLPGAGVPTPLRAGTNGIPVYFTQYETELTLNYEIDIWRKNRKRLRAAIGDYKAREADLAFIRLELGISVAQTYFRLQVNYRRKEIASAIVENRQKRLQLTRDRVRGNLGSLSEILSVENELTDSRRQLLLVEADISTDEYMLKAYLAGDFEDRIEDITIEKLPLPEVPLPKNLPLHLISKRPDITAQLWLIESAGQRIEVAKIGFYPDFNLFALFGFQTLHLNQLFNQKSTYFNVDPAVTLPIFDGGRLLANLRESETDYDSTIFRYNQLILNAAQEVLTDVALLRNSVERFEEFKRQTGIEKNILELVSLRQKNHLDSGLNFLDREREFLEAEAGELTARNELIGSILSLIKALGGGYDPCIEG